MQLALIVAVVLLVASNVVTAYRLYRELLLRAEREGSLASDALRRTATLEQQLDDIRAMQLGVERDRAVVQDAPQLELDPAFEAALQDIEDPVARGEFEELIRYRVSAEPNLKPANLIAELLG